MKVTALVALLLLGSCSAQLLTTSEPRELCLPEVSEQCPAEDPPSAIHLPDPENCAAFCECSGGTAFKLYCMLGLYYDADVRVCNWPNNVDCGDRPLPPLY